MLCAIDVMTPDCHSVAPTLSVADLNDTLSSRGVSGFPVTIDGRPIGVVSRTDILRCLENQFAYAAGVGDFYRAQGEAEPQEAPLSSVEEGAIAGARLAKLRVKEIMTRRIVSVAPGDSVAQVARTLIDQNVNRVLVVADERLRGILSATDLVRAVAQERLVPPA